MLTLKTELLHKPADFRLPDCQIAKIIELSGKDFDSHVARPNAYKDYITENKDLMGTWDGVNHCLLVLGEGRSDGVLIEASGYDYARYTAYIPHARDFVEREMERLADFFMKDIAPDPKTGEIEIYLGDIAEHTGAEEIRDDSEIARMLYRALEKHPGVGSVEPLDDCLVVTPASTQTQGVAGGLKLRDVLLLGSMENVYMVHETIDVGFISAGHFEMLTGKGRGDFEEVLNAAVTEIRPGAYGTEIVLSGVDPQAMMDFDQAAADHIQAESQMGLGMRSHNLY